MTKQSSEKKLRRYRVREGTHVEVYSDPATVEARATGADAGHFPGLGGVQVVYSAGEVFATVREIPASDTKFEELPDWVHLTHKPNLPEHVPNGEEFPAGGQGTSYGHGLSEAFQHSPEYKGKVKAKVNKVAADSEAEAAPPHSHTSHPAHDAHHSAHAAGHAGKKKSHGE